MYDDSDLDAAVAAGTLSANAAQDLRRFVAGRRSDPPAPDRDRHFRYIVGVADILPAIGVLLLLAGATAVAMPITRSYTGVVLVVGGWLLSYRFAQRRSGIPTMLLFCAFAFGCVTFLTALTYGLGATMKTINPTAGVVVAGGSALACWSYWRRFRLPIAVPTALLAFSTIGDHLLMIVIPSPPTVLVTAWTLLVAAGMFVTAMWWDASDIYRQTIRADVAFWTQALAAFLLDAAIFRATFGYRGAATGWDSMWALPPGTLDVDAACFAVAITICFCLLALIIDRRGMVILSTLLLVAVCRKSFTDIGVAIALIATGGLTLALTLNWMTCRRKLLAWLPDPVRAQVPRSDPQFWYARPVA